MKKALVVLAAFGLLLVPAPAKAALSTYNSKIQIESHLPGELYGPAGYGIYDVARTVDYYTSSQNWFVARCDGTYRCIKLYVDWDGRYTVWGGAVTRYWSSGNAEIWFSKALLGNPQWAQRHAMAHEMWHAVVLNSFHSTGCNIMYYRIVNGCYRFSDYQKQQLRLH